MMTAGSSIPNVTSIVYPVYVNPIINNTRVKVENGEILTIEGKVITTAATLGLGLLSELYTLDGYFEEDKNRLHIADLYSRSNIIDGEYKRPYQQRLAHVRTIVQEVANRKVLLDCGARLVYNSNELIQLYKESIKAGFLGLQIRSPEGTYKDKQVNNITQELMELRVL